MFEFFNILITNSFFKWSAILIIFVSILYRYICSKCNYWEKLGVHTASVSLYKRFACHWNEWEEELVRKNPKVFGIYELTKPVLYVRDPELVKDVLVKDFHIFTNRRDFASGNNPIIDNFLSVIKDENWKRVRTIMSPTFSTGKLRRMRPLIDECLQTLSKNIEIYSKSGDEVELKRLFGAFSMEVVIQVAFGTKVDALFDENNPIIVNARKIFNKNISPKQLFAILLPKLAKIFKIEFFDRKITDFFTEFTLRIIEERKNSNNKGKRFDFLQIMLDAKENNGSDYLDEENSNDLDEKYSEPNFSQSINRTLTNDELVSQSVLFFLAGYDTTATTISMSIYNMALNPETQEKLYEEIKPFFKTNNQIDYDVVHSLKYLDAVLMESLRLYPPAIFLERVSNQSYELGNTGIKLEKDQLIHIPTYAMHRDPDNFPDPESFKPERFLAENRVHHPYMHLPFGAGPRNCVGMRLALIEAKLAIMNCIHGYRFSITDKTSCPPDFYNSGGLMVPKEVFIKVEKRQ